MEELSSYLEQINKLLFENLFEDAKALLLFVETDIIYNPLNSSLPRNVVQLFYIKYMLCLLILRELMDAKYLWKRLSNINDYRSQELTDIWFIGIDLLKDNVGEAYIKLNNFKMTSLIDQVDGQLIIHLIKQFIAAIRNWEISRMSTAFVTVPFEYAANKLGCIHNELENECKRLNWKTQDGIIYPESTDHKDSFNSSSDQDKVLELVKLMKSIEADKLQTLSMTTNTTI